MLCLSWAPTRPVNAATGPRTWPTSNLLVVQELYLTETARLADVVLPAVSWAECDGTFTNLERRVQRARRALQNQDIQSCAGLAHLRPPGRHAWASTGPLPMWKASRMKSHRPCPMYSGLTWDALGDQGIQWDAALVRARPSYRKVTQPDLPRNRPRLCTGTPVRYCTTTARSSRAPSRCATWPSGRRRPSIRTMRPNSTSSRASHLVSHERLSAP